MSGNEERAVGVYTQIIGQELQPHPLRQTNVSCPLGETAGGCVDVHRRACRTGYSDRRPIQHRDTVSERQAGEHCHSRWPLRTGDIQIHAHERRERESKVRLQRREPAVGAFGEEMVVTHQQRRRIHRDDGVGCVEQRVGDGGDVLRFQTLAVQPESLQLGPRGRVVDYEEGFAAGVVGDSQGVEIGGAGGEVGEGEFLGLDVVGVGVAGEVEAGFWGGGGVDEDALQ